LIDQATLFPNGRRLEMQANWPSSRSALIIGVLALSIVCSTAHGASAAVSARCPTNPYAVIAGVKCVSSSVIRPTAPSLRARRHIDRKLVRPQCFYPYTHARVRCR
jgi:hypothetical protein